MYNAGLIFALLLLLFLGRIVTNKQTIVLVVGESLIKILLYLPILFNFTMLSSLLKILHYCPISPCIQQPCSAALPGSLARQACPAALSGSLARQACPAALPGSLVRQSCPAALPGSSTNFDRI
jgi:hypothetical protein